MECLAECYNNVDHWSSQRQILSIIADKVNLKDLQRWILNLSRYRLNIARRYVAHHQYPHNSGLAFRRENSETVLKHWNKGSQFYSKSYPWANCLSVSKLLQWCGLLTNESQHAIESSQCMFRIHEPENLWRSGLCFSCQRQSFWRKVSWTKHGCTSLLIPGHDSPLNITIFGDIAINPDPET